MYWLVDVRSGKRINTADFKTEEAAKDAAESISFYYGGKRIDILNAFGHIVLSVGGK